MALNSLKIGNIRTYFVEEIRRELTEMGKTNWEIQLNWVNVHIGIQGYELDHTLTRGQRRTCTVHQRMLQENSKKCSDK